MSKILLVIYALIAVSSCDYIKNKDFQAFAGIFVFTSTILLMYIDTIANQLKKISA